MYYVKLVVNESEGGNSCFELLPRSVRDAGTDIRVEVMQCTCLAKDGGCSMIRITDPKSLLSNEVIDRTSYSNDKGECTIDRVSSHQLVAMVMNNNCIISRVLSESGCLITSAVMEDNEHICWTVVGPSTTYIKNLIDALAGVGVNVKRKSTLKADFSILLSNRQEEAVRVALEQGFYEIPRKINLEDLSKVLGCSKSTLDITLRNAEKKIMNHYMLQNRNSIIGKSK
jgi:predicted DNA binding protein